MKIRFSYWIRPYDAISDARRWRWHRPPPCARQVWAQMPADAQQALKDAIARARAAERDGEWPQ